MSFMSTHSLLAFPPSRHIARENHCHSFAYAHTTRTGNIYFAVEWNGRGKIIPGGKDNASDYGIH